MLNQDSMKLGAILGFIIPLIGFGIIFLIYERLDATGYISDRGMGENFRIRTVALLAICLNLIPFTIYNGLKHTQTMRGFIFPTVLFAVVWYFMFGKELL